MEFRILGPLEAVENDRALPLGGPKQRALLGVLLLHANEVVPSGRLAEELWGESPPNSARRLVQGYVYGLRRVLGAEVLATQPPGYRLELANGALDLTRFQQLLEQAASLPPEGAAPLLREALALWRGPALADVGARGAGAARGRAPERAEAERADRARAGRPRAGAPRGARGRAGGSRRRASAQRAPARPADAGAVSLRPPVRGPAGLPADARDAGRPGHRAERGAAGARAPPARARPRADVGGRGRARTRANPDPGGRDQSHSRAAFGIAHTGAARPCTEGRERRLLRSERLDGARGAARPRGPAPRRS